MNYRMDYMDYLASLPWGFPGNNTGVGRCFLLQGNLSDPRIEPASPALAGRFFTAESPGKYFTSFNLETQ